MKKLLAFIGTVVWAVSVWGIYTLARNRAIADATNGRKFRLNCNPSISLENCRFTELPVPVQWVSDVYVPTGLYAALSLALIIFMVKLLRHPADPSLAGCSGDK